MALFGVHSDAPLSTAFPDRHGRASRAFVARRSGFPAPRHGGAWCLFLGAALADARQRRAAAGCKGSSAAALAAWRRPVQGQSARVAPRDRRHLFLGGSRASSRHSDAAGRVTSPAAIQSSNRSLARSNGSNHQVLCVMDQLIQTFERLSRHTPVQAQGLKCLARSTG